MPLAANFSQLKSLKFSSLVAICDSLASEGPKAVVLCPEDFPKSANVTHLPLTGVGVSGRMEKTKGKYFPEPPGMDRLNGSYQLKYTWRTPELTTASVR